MNKKSKIGISVVMSTEYDLDLHIPQKRKDLNYFFFTFEKGGIEFYL